MECSRCENKVVMNKLCKDHFIENFENKVYDTIDKYDLIPEDAKLLVGVSGGKDSLTVLHLLAQKYKDITAYAVDEGISGYRDETLVDAKIFCEERNIPIIIESVKQNFNVTLDQAVPVVGVKPCNVCGVFRRYLLNKHREYDFMVTGHNLDDEIQSLMMNIFKNQIHLLARLGPKPGLYTSDKFLQRVKPLYFCSEKEVMAYTFLKGFKTSFVECPYAKTSFRAKVRDEINEYESKNPGTKLNIIETLLEVIPPLQKSMKEEKVIITSCVKCGEPATREVCHACSLKNELKPLIMLQ
jgi:tRNA-5-methyluridine54 2-sulfurtransferase